MLISRLGNRKRRQGESRKAGVQDQKGQALPAAKTRQSQTAFFVKASRSKQPSPASRHRLHLHPNGAIRHMLRQGAEAVWNLDVRTF